MANIVRIINLPLTIKGLTVPDADGNYNIYINYNLSYEAQIETLRHETEHINNDDFSSNDSVVTLENRVKYSTERR